MKLIASLAEYKKPYQYLINNLRKDVNRSTLSATNQQNYNTILKGLNSIKAELKKNRNNIEKLHQAQILRRKHRRATKVQAHIRGFLTRTRINRDRYVSVKGPNGNISIAVMPHRASGFRAIAAATEAKRLNKARLNAIHNQNARNWAAAHTN
jgi:hypothetical protein